MWGRGGAKLPNRDSIGALWTLHCGLSAHVTALISTFRFVCASSRPSGTVHTESTLSAVAEQRRAPSDENFMQRTAGNAGVAGPAAVSVADSMAAPKTLTSLPLVRSHSAIAPSAPPVASHLPAGSTAMATGVEGGATWPLGNCESDRS